MEYLTYTAEVFVIVTAIRALFLMSQISIYLDDKYRDRLKKMFGG